MTIQVYTSTVVADKVGIVNFNASVQEGSNHTPKQDVLIIIGNWNAKVGNNNQILMDDLG